jgi:hypothetical protein
MADDGTGEVSRQLFSVAYSGAHRLDDHTIDVESRAPALLAFGRLIRASNAEFNGKRTAVKILVTSDFEHKCFNINFELVVSVLDQLKTLVGVIDHVKDAKEILEWVGLTTTASGGMSFFAFLRWRKGRKIVEKTDIVDQDKSGSVVVSVEGDHNPVTVNNHVYNLSVNPTALNAARDTFSPIGVDGMERMEIRNAGGPPKIIEPEETQDILASCNAALIEAGENVPEVQETTAWLSVYSPVYDIHASKWRFRFGKETIYADISETKIAEAAVKRGAALADDAYEVRLEVTTPIDKQVKRGTPSYKILRVNKFIPASPTVQSSLFDDMN